MLNPMRTKFYVPNAMVKGVFSPIVAFAVFGTLFGQAQETASPTPQPKVNPDNPALRTPGKPSGSASPEEPQINPQALERLTKAADKVLNRIQSEENDLYLRVNYFEKPDGITSRYMANQHFWEIGMRGFRIKDVVRRMSVCFEILSIYRNRDWLPSQNFVLKSRMIS